MKKMISRRNFLKVCAVAGSAVALSACGGSKKAAAPDPSNTDQTSFDIVGGQSALSPGYNDNSINGVSKLHSEIIKESVFHDYYLFKPNAFKNVTNGIAYRRWLLASNPGLCKLLDETIGDGYKHDASLLPCFLTKPGLYARTAPRPYLGL